MLSGSACKDADRPLKGENKDSPTPPGPTKSRANHSTGAAKCTSTGRTN